MTDLEKAAKELAAEADSRGFLVPPYYLEKITALAAKIAKAIADHARFDMNVHHVMMALELVKIAMKEDCGNG